MLIRTVWVVFFSISFTLTTIESSATLPFSHFEAVKETKEESSSSPVVEKAEGEQMFYGLWKVTHVVAEDLRFPDQGNVVGDWVLINEKEYRHNQTRMKNPLYVVKIIPENPIPYYPHLPNQSLMGLTKTTYYTLIDPYGTNDSVFLKDKNTLILYRDMVCYELTRQQNQPKLFSQVPKKELPITKIRTDVWYKLFYGEWKVVQSWEGEAQPDPFLLNSRFSFSQHQYAFSKKNAGEKKQVIKEPTYKVTFLSPTEKLLGQTASYSFLKELGLKGPYYTYFAVSQDTYEFGFFIQDDETLILSYEGAYYQLKRTAHIENYIGNYESA